MYRTQTNEIDLRRIKVVILERLMLFYFLPSKYNTSASMVITIQRVIHPSNLLYKIRYLKCFKLYLLQNNTKVTRY